MVVLGCRVGLIILEMAYPPIPDNFLTSKEDNQR